MRNIQNPQYLNKRTEVSQKCRHRAKFRLSNQKWQPKTIGRGGEGGAHKLQQNSEINKGCTVTYMGIQRQYQQQYRLQIRLQQIRAKNNEEYQCKPKVDTRLTRPDDGQTCYYSLKNFNVKSRNICRRKSESNNNKVRHVITSINCTFWEDFS